MTLAGRLNQQITIETPTAGEDELGQTDTAGWTLLATVWAEAKETMGREFLSGDYQAEEKVAFRIRWMEVDSTARVTWEGRVYRIVSVTGTYPSRERWLHCISQEGSN